MSGSKKPTASSIPPLNAGSKEEEEFITKFMEEELAKESKEHH